MLMKTSFKLLSFLLVTLLLTGISSCKKEDPVGTGTFEFSMTLPADLGLTKSASADNPLVSYQLMVSIEDLKGNPVMTDKMIPVYSFGTGYVSGKVEIKNGEYKLSKFMVINAEGAVLFASPLAGSPNSYLVSKPLPINFNIIPDKVTTLIPEALAVGNQPPSAFGYVAFGVQLIKPLDFWTMCVIGFSNPQIMAPVQITEAKLTISNNNGWMYAFKLAAAPNHLVIRGGSENYTFLLEKDGYPSQKMQFTSGQLLAATEKNPLVLNINAESQVYTLSLQPGPEQGKDAMISNLEPDKNFGDYKYFEATYLSESQLTVMRSNRSLIFFDLSSLPSGAKINKVVLRLVYEKPIPFDETLFPTVAPASGIAWYGAVLQQITEPWEENGVTWNKQPKTTEANQVFIPPFIRNTNVLEIEVTKLFVSNLASPLPNHGILFKLWPAEKFPGFRFVSSDYPEPSWRPKLNIQYTK
jgi:hypothetical protein